MHRAGNKRKTSTLYLMNCDNHLFIILKVGRADLSTFQNKICYQRQLDRELANILPLKMEGVGWRVCPTHFLQRTRVQIPALSSGYSRLPVPAAAEDLTHSSGLLRYLHPHKHIYTIKGTPLKSGRKKKQYQVIDQRNMKGCNLQGQGLEQSICLPHQRPQILSHHHENSYKGYHKEKPGGDQESLALQVQIDMRTANTISDTIRKQFKNNDLETRKKNIFKGAQWVKVSATKHDNLTSIHG